GVLPRRRLTARLVPSGIDALVAAAVQLTVPPASRTRDVKVPVAAYGAKRTASTTRPPAPTVKSENAGRIAARIACACVATTAPSIANVTAAAVHSMLN